MRAMMGLRDRGRSKVESMSDRNERACHFCGTRCREWCPTCIAAFDRRRPVSEMTVEERVSEVLSWLGIVEIPFDKIHQRVTELMGRSVFTHEMAYPDSLVAELRRGRPANLAEIVDKVPAEKLVTIGLEGNGAGSA